MNAPKLPKPDAPSDVVESYLTALAEAGFEGEIEADLAQRLVHATDNSIYQILPSAVIAPRHADDLALLVKVANRSEFLSLSFLPRGGGTSTNGQTLGSGVVVDTSRHMTRVLNYDHAQGLVTVEPGLIRDALNAFLEPHGRFFAPHVSTTSRATIGGMVSNDSSGKGSVLYGKTSDHVVRIDMILPDGSEVSLNRGGSSPGAASLCSDLDALLAPETEAIRAQFPQLVRGFTGYNLLEARSDAGVLDPTKLICGSEGTLGFIKSVVLQTTPIPKAEALAVLTYASHEDGLRAVPQLLDHRPSAIEFIDDKILGAALRSPFADDVRDVLGIKGETPGLAAHFLELNGDDPDALAVRLGTLQSVLRSPLMPHAPLSVRLVHDPAQIARVWEIRRACQGLLAGFDKSRRAVAFVEDCAVPPENLADFVQDLEAELQSRGFPLGMYGHADVGCVHIRPLMDPTDARFPKDIRAISDAVFKLTQKRGGLLWGEHGKGFRGEYTEAVIGPELYTLMRKIKARFDPTDRMNPGKIARPWMADAGLTRLDAAPMRGVIDAKVTPDLRPVVAAALRCDGNGACFGRDMTQPMCPSYKASGDRTQSPKGRAALLRAWAQARSTDDAAGLAQVSKALDRSLDTCLSCKACGGAACPARVDIPEMKSEYLAWRYRDALRPVADVLIRNLERSLPMLDHVGGLVNRIQSLTPARSLARALGLVDLPRLRNRCRFHARLAELGVSIQSGAQILKSAQSAKTVVIVQDAFTSFYDADVVLAQVALIRRLGFNPVLLTYQPTGKPLHVRGMLESFKTVAARQSRDLEQLSNAGLPLVGVDPAATLIYRHEYRHALTEGPHVTVQLLSEWLAQVPLPKLEVRSDYVMIQHCTERALVPGSEADWSRVFSNVGLNLRITRKGCCGMAGLFGHEARHLDMSRMLYDLSWRETCDATPDGALIATGYSCRSQVKRFGGRKALHPAQALLAAWDAQS